MKARCQTRQQFLQRLARGARGTYRSPRAICALDADVTQHRLPPPVQISFCIRPEEHRAVRFVDPDVERRTPGIWSSTGRRPAAIDSVAIVLIASIGTRFTLQLSAPRNSHAIKRCPPPQRSVACSRADRSPENLSGPAISADYREEVSGRLLRIPSSFRPAKGKSSRTASCPSGSPTPLARPRRRRPAARRSFCAPGSARQGWRTGRVRTFRDVRTRSSARIVMNEAR